MKKTLIALAALAATGAFAQSTVTLYGRLDAGYSANTTTTTTAAGVSTEARDNGINNNGLATSYWGMRGSEDLGGGLRANFNLETDVQIDTGTTGTSAGAGATAFDRISTIGLSGGFGSVMVGRFYTPMFLSTNSTDVFGTGGAYTVNLFTDGVRASNAVWYSTPAMGGFSAMLMLGRNDTGTTAANATSGVTGLKVNYAAGPLMVTAAYSKTESTAAGVDLENTGATIGGTYDFGVAKLFANYIRDKNQSNPGFTTFPAFNEKTEANLGVSVPMGAVTILAAYGRNTQDTVVAAGVVDGQSGNDYVVGVTYDLSKRTALYVKTGVYNKLDNTALSSGSKTQTTALGMRHLF
ncbi:porin [Rhodoferax sp. UBA5149]|uniref:porin n=1 Tax=Rhodoferax sp. UBA5149 TaxID=1947379 RepID=UPI0025E4981A|nr:porin [Rhodoferax sp. UBA5149]